MSDSEFPWLWPYGGDEAAFNGPDIGANDVCSRLNCLRENSAAIKPAALLPTFVPSCESLGALEYEHRVSHGSIPTRNLSHDWYNGLVWLAFPQAKQSINERHIAESQYSSGRFSDKSISEGNGRSRLRDTLTLFDESGAVLLTTDPGLSQALLDHDWNRLFVRQPASWVSQSRLLVFGHGLLDSMHVPYKGLCAKVVPVHVPDLDPDPHALRAMMAQLVSLLEDPVNLSPLPVMGIPGWFDVSREPGYYSDPQVFRAKPTRHVHSLHKRLAFEWDGATLR